VSRSPRTLLAALLLVPAGALAQQAVNPIHPVFPPLDASGKPAASSAAVSAEVTCGGCHDAKYIATHSAHGDARAKATCLQCHVDGGRLPTGKDALDAEGHLKRDFIRIGAPRPASCATCHGVVTPGVTPVTLPADLEAVPAPGGRTLSLTLGEGAVVSGQRMNESFLNLEDKTSLAAPWDVHAAKLVECASCHYARNNPARTDSRQTSLLYLSSDPRRPTMAEFLLRPDHRLAEPDCRACHDPLKAHGFLPYRERHMEVLACTACHAARPRAPAAEQVDETVVTLDGNPAVIYRNLERRDGEALNAATVRPLEPLLTMRAGADGVRRLSPVNIVSRFCWVSRADGNEVPFGLVQKAYLEDGHYAPEVLALLDGDGDGRLSATELRLTHETQVAAIAGRLRALGVVDPVVRGRLEPHPIAHGISSRDQAQHDCTSCHGEGSRLGRPFVLAAYLPDGASPRPPEDGGRIELSGTIAPTSTGGLALSHGEHTGPYGLHVLGYSREGKTNLLGFLLFLAVALGVAVHGGARLVLRRKARSPTHAAASDAQDYVFGRYERLWHWTMAASGVVLIVTGLAIHGAGNGSFVGLAAAVAMHNTFAVVLMVNAFLALFHHLSTAAIRNFIPHPHGLVARILEHVEYQSRGIFYGSAHPKNVAGHKLNPLQQLTYLALLNVLFPLQIGTGLLIWAVGHWPSVAAAVGGLQLVAPLHNLGAWLFLSFFVLHVYLVTTGRTVGEHLRSMVTGYQHVEPETSGAQGE
jgi:thiosulfate reductase cytochrome b subunit